MNVILLLIDSLNRHHLEPYGCDYVRTPNFQAFAEKGVVMTRHFAGSLPCMPARREIMAGVREFPWRGWGHMEAFDTHLAECARKQGAVTKMITDHYHYFEHNSHGYFESFQGYDFIRGQEIDAWRTEMPATVPAWVRRIDEFRGDMGERYFRNIQGFSREEDWFTPRVFTAAQEWLRTNRETPFFLFMDHFEVHEPFHCIEPYRSLYTDDTGEGLNIWPPYQSEAESVRFFEQTTERELAYIRNQYWGKVTWVDAYLGRLMETLDELRLWDDTMIVITTDHGHDLGEWRPRFGKQPPHHDSHAHLPLLIWYPEAQGGGRRLNALTSTVDLHATVREALGEQVVHSSNSRSLLPLLRGETSEHRRATLCGTFGHGAMVANGDFAYYQQPSGPPMAFSYTGYQPHGAAPEAWSAAEAGRFLPNVQFPVWRMPRHGGLAAPAADHRLYRHTEGDPTGQANIIGEEPDTARRMRALLAETLAEDGCPPEQFTRLGLNP